MWNEIRGPVKRMDDQAKLYRYYRHIENLIHPLTAMNPTALIEIKCVPVRNIHTACVCLIDCVSWNKAHTDDERTKPMEILIYNGTKQVGFVRRVCNTWVHACQEREMFVLHSIPGS